MRECGDESGGSAGSVHPIAKCPDSGMKWLSGSRRKMKPWLTRISRWNRDRTKGRSLSRASVSGDAKEGVLFDRRAAGRFGLLDHVIQ